MFRKKPVNRRFEFKNLQRKIQVFLQLRFEMNAKLFILLNLSFLANGAHNKDKKDSKDQQKESGQSSDYNPLGALVRLVENQ